MIKILSFALVLLSLGDSALSQGKVVDFSLGEARVCLLYGDRARCVSKSNNDRLLSSREGFNNAIKIVSGRDFDCVLDDDGVWCWGVAYEYDRASVPVLRNPTFIEIDHFQICAVDSGELVCWGQEQKPYISLAPKMQKITEVHLEWDFACVLQKDGVPLCWSDERRIPDPPKGIVFSTIMTSHHRACGISDGKVICWLGQVSDAINHDVEKAFAHGNRICVVNRTSKVKCDPTGQELRDQGWLDPVDPPTLNSPVDMLVSIRTACVLGSDRMKCVGGTLFDVSH